MMIEGLDKATKQEIFDAYCAARNAADERENIGDEAGAAYLEEVRKTLRDEMFKRGKMGKPYVIAIDTVYEFETAIERDLWAEAEAKRWGLRIERNEFGDIALHDDEQDKIDGKRVAV